MKDYEMLCENCNRIINYQVNLKYCDNCKKLKRKGWRKISDMVNRARRNGVIHNFTKEEWIAKIELTKGVCPECEGFIGIMNLTLDHIKPLSKVPIGFVYTIEDVQPLCKSCNSSKGNNELRTE